MAENIRFSVIIPAYNAAATILASVGSCLAQSYPPYQVIIVDDSSTDGTKAALEGAFGDRVAFIQQAKNSGPAAARNAGLRIAAGTHIAFQDADDIWHREKLEHIAQVLQARPDVDFLFHPYTLAPVDFPVRSAMLQPRRYPMWKLLLSNPIGTPCVVLKRAAALPFNEGWRYMEDYELFLRMAQAHGVYRIAAPFTQLGRPILSAGGQSSRRWKMRLGEIRAWWAFAGQHPIYLPLVLPLILFALAKHFVKSFFPPRTNY